MKILCKKLDELWKENKGMVILYIWTQFLKEESMSVLGIGDTLDLTGFILFLEVNKINFYLSQLIVEYDST